MMIMAPAGESWRPSIEFISVDCNGFESAVPVSNPKKKKDEKKKERKELKKKKKQSPVVCDW